MAATGSDCYVLTGVTDSFSTYYLSGVLYIQLYKYNNCIYFYFMLTV